MNLNRITSNWSFQERERLNQNWTIIENYLSNLQGQIRTLSGDEDVMELIERLNNALNQGELTLDELQTALSDATTVINNAQDATNDANVAAQDALNAIADIQNIISDFGSKGVYNDTTTYKRNNIAYKDGCSYIYINNTPSSGNPPPPYPTISNAYWHILADKGASGSGAVSKVNGKEPNGSGEITLEPADLGAASNTNLTELQQQVTTHLDESNYIFNSDSEPTNADVAIMKDGDIFVVYGNIYGTILNQYFRGQNNTTPYDSFLNTFSSTINTNAQIGVDTQYIINNRLESFIRPTVDGVFVIREFIGKNAFQLPTNAGDKINLELSTFYGSPRENIFGVGIINNTASTSPGNGGLSARSDYLRIHYSQSDTVNANAVNIGQNISGTTSNPFTQNRTINVGRTIKVRMELERMSNGNYIVRWYEDDVFMGVQDNLVYNNPTFYPFFYNQVGSSIAGALNFESLKIW